MGVGVNLKLMVIVEVLHVFHAVHLETQVRVVSLILGEYLQHPDYQVFLQLGILAYTVEIGQFDKELDDSRLNDQVAVGNGQVRMEQQ